MTRKRGSATIVPPTQAYTRVTETPDWMKVPAPCSEEENEYAHHLVWAVLAGEVTTEQARRVLNEIFLGRELEL